MNLRQLGAIDPLSDQNFSPAQIFVNFWNADAIRCISDWLFELDLIFSFIQKI